MSAGAAALASQPCFAQMLLLAWQAVSCTKTSALTSLASRLTAGIGVVVLRSLGGAKTPALEPMLHMLRVCVNRLPHFAPGSPAHSFHMVEPVEPMMIAAAMSKLRDTDGYGIIAAGEDGPMLCPAWPSNGTWTQNTHINLQRLLNSAHGGSATWETVFDRNDRKAASVEAMGNGH